VDEEWRPVVGYETSYEVSSLGRVRSLDRIIYRENRWKQTGPHRLKGRILKSFLLSGGYPSVALTAMHKAKIHHLVLEAFVGPRPEGLLGLHEDDDKTNTKLSNLYWGTYSKNWDDAIKNKKHSLDRLLKHIVHINRRKRKLTDEQVRTIKQLFAEGHTAYRVEQLTGIHRSTTILIQRGRTYVDIQC